MTNPVELSRPKNCPITLQLEPYTSQMNLWPPDGRHILAQYDSDYIVVYQAFNSSIAEYAVKHQSFGGDFKLSRMSWIKTNFSWMQYRSGWNTKQGQERTLAVKIRREGFNKILEEATEGKYHPDFGLEEVWLERKLNGDVRLQWDPDYLPILNPQKLDRRAIQLGLKGEVLKKYSKDWIVSIEDITEFVVELRSRLEDTSGCSDEILKEIWTPVERIYPVDEGLKYLNIKRR